MERGHMTTRAGRQLTSWAAVLCAGALALGTAPALADGEIVQVNPDGSVSRTQVVGDWNGNQYVDCTSGLCNPCGICHADTNKGYDSNRHTQSYYPRAALAVRDGARLPWAYRGSLVARGDRLCALDSKDSVRLCFPARDSWVLKDAAGRPAALWSVSAPTR